MRIALRLLLATTVPLVCYVGRAKCADTASASAPNQCQAPSRPEHHKYCVVGAGPAGVQLSTFLHAAGRDFVLLERNDRAASFFHTYPVHRTLNSINRRFTRRGLANGDEYGLRHDWNSLLRPAGEEPNLFTSKSKEYWPSADDLVKYVNEFAAPMEAAGALRYGVNVTKISACKGSGRKKKKKRRRRKVCRYLLTSESAQEGCSVPVHKTYSCGTLIMANGMWRPRQVEGWIHGLNKVAISYDELADIPVERFENRSVMIVGAGNAATETVDAIRNHARDILMVSRSRPKQMKDTRYVGHVRGRRTTILDAFNFKSYEGFLVIEGTNTKTVFTPCGPDQVNRGFDGRPPVCSFEQVGHSSSELVLLAPVHPTHSKLIAEARRAFGGLVFTREATSKMQGNRKFAGVLSTSYQPAYQVKEILCTSTKTLDSELTVEQRQLLLRLRDISTEVTAGGVEWQKPYDVVITALGWTYDTSLFHRSVRLDMISAPGPSAGEDTYLEISSEFESTSAKHLFVVGAAAHGRDRYRYQASGGFIHGFRFNARTLWRMLDERYEQSQFPDSTLRERLYPTDMDGSTPYAWPKVFPAAKRAAGRLSPEALPEPWAHLLRRVNSAAGPYEMTGGSLADAIVYDCANQTSWYVEDVTEDLIHERYKDHPRLIWSFYFGANNGLEATMCSLRTESFGVFSQFIHPVLQYYAPGVVPSGDKPGQAERAQDNTLHPSTFWPKPERGISRLHIKDAWLTLDWSDTGVVGALEFFRGHIEQAAADFCQGKGDGVLKQAFDERFDPHLYNQEFVNQVKRADAECRNEGAVSKGDWRTCDECARIFVEGGGCEALRSGKSPIPYVPSGCDACEAAAVAACQS